MSSYYTSSSTSSTTDSEVEEKMKNLKLEEKEVNILLLGETGVGKSTFINAIANYLSLKYFSDAEEKGLVKLIPTVYNMQDKNGKKHEIKIGPKKDKNECLKTGESATQNVKTYVFPISQGHAKVRLIDTPGMGDTRGIEQDEKNCKNIISYITTLEKLHAICFLCKSTVARKTIYFDYCVYQILSHLEMQAAKNVFFLFTNTRGSDYKAGESLSIIKTIVKSIDNISGVKIPLEKENIYCFENEGFRYLGACEKKIQFDDTTKKKCMESWKHSAVQCWKLVRYLQKEIEPYTPSKLTELNCARNMLFQFSKVLAEIKQQIADNQCVLDRLQANKNKEYDSISELKNQKTAVTDVIIKKMSQPMLVCTSVPSCAQVYRIKGVDKWHHKRICHSCYELSSSIRMSITGCPEIVNCHAIDNNTRKCTKCGCDFLLHMHVDYITSLEENLMVDEDVGHRLATRESLLNNYTEIADDIKVHNVQFQSEYDILKGFCMNISRYIKDHAIVVFSESYKEYISYLINQNKASGDSDWKKSVDNLQKLRLEYIEAEQVYQQALKSPLISRDDLYFDMKEEKLQTLFKLKEKGKKLQEIYLLERVLNTGGCNANEYVHGSWYVGDKKAKGADSKSRKHQKGRGRNRVQGPRQEAGASRYPERPDSRSSGAGFPQQPYQNMHPPNSSQYASPNFTPSHSDRGDFHDPPSYGHRPPPYGSHYAPPYGPYYPPPYGSRPPPSSGPYPPPPYAQHSQEPRHREYANPNVGGFSRGARSGAPNDYVNRGRYKNTGSHRRGDGNYRGRNQSRGGRVNKDGKRRQSRDKNERRGSSNDSDSS